MRVLSTQLGPAQLPRPLSLSLSLSLFLSLTLTVVLAMGTSVGLSAQPAPTAQLIVSDARPDAAASTVTITGENFGRRPLVTLDLIPVRVENASETEIVAAVPVSLMPAGDYLLTVSRGPAPTEHATFDLTLDEGEASSVESIRADPLVISGDQGEVAAQVGGTIITLDEVDLEWQRTDPRSYIEWQQRAYEMRRQIADRLVNEELLAIEAEARGVTTEQLLEAELPTRLATLPQGAVRSLYQSLGAVTLRTTFEQMEPALRAWLQKVTEPELAKANYLDELTKVSTRVERSLTPPRVQVARTDQDAVLGSADASIELVAFGDFQNAAYARHAQTFGRLIDTFGGQLRIVFKNLPALDRAAGLNGAEAGQCARAQDQFWPYHDLLIAQQGIFDIIRLKQLASEIGLDRDQFDSCLDGGEFRDVVQRAVEEAGRYAIQVSPNFLINGRFAPAPPAFLPPVEFLTRLIEEELLVQASTPAP